MTADLGRQPITLVEIDLPICSRVFGTAPCTAVLSAAYPDKCFNTRATCAAPAAYAATTQTLRFAPNQSGLPKDGTVFPALVAVSSRAAEINLSGIDPRTSPLGKRARVTVTLQDFAYHDRLTDPYQAERLTGAANSYGRSYDPAVQGTFFGRLLARHPYYVGRALRVRRGYVGDAPASMETAHYVITAIAGPDAGGTVEITAADVLNLAEDEKAVVPAPSRGKLAAPITATELVAILTPAGVGAEYPASGRVAIGREVVTFWRSGDTLNLTGRGADGSTPQSHAVNDLVQVCARYEDDRICDIIYDMLVSKAGIDGGFIDLSEWQAENDNWLAGITGTATVAKPMGVATAIGELQQVGVMVWWDEIAQKIRFAVNRPLAPGETAYPINDRAHLITGTPEVERGDALRISQLHFWHGVINPTESADSDGNFSKLVVGAVTDDPHEQAQIKTMYCRWFGQTGDDVSASVIVERLVERYRMAPRIVSGALDVKDRDLALGDIVSVETRALQSATGATVPVLMQIDQLERGDGRVSFRAQEYRIEGRFGYIMTDPQPDYDTATAAERAEGCFIMDDTVGVFPDGTGPYVIF